MVSSEHLLGFALASLVLIIIPGPGVLFVVGRALAHGRRTALATALGHAAGNYVVAAYVAVGLGALLERSVQAFVIVKVGVRGERGAGLVRALTAPLYHSGCSSTPRDTPSASA
jgi:LysE type translocator